MVGRKRKRPDFWGWDDIDELFERFMKDVRELFRELEREPEIFESRPMFVSFRIVQDGKNPPKIEFSRGGPGIRPVEEERPKRIEIKPARREKPVAKYEEAPYTYNVDPNSVKIEIKVEGVESEENVEMEFGEESVEVKVYSPKDKKNYFAVLPLPAGTDPENTEIKVEKDRVLINIPRQYRVTRF